MGNNNNDIEFGFSSTEEDNLSNGGFSFGSNENIDDHFSFGGNDPIVVEDNNSNNTKIEQEVLLEKENLFPQETSISNTKNIPDYDALIHHFDEIFEITIEKRISDIPVAIHFDFNKMNPLEAEKEATKVATNAKLNATIYNYLKKHEFTDINIEILKDLEGFKDLSPDEKITFIEKSIFELSKNDSCVKDVDFLKKLYKLKSIEQLVQDSIDVDNIYFKQKEIKEKVLALINNYYSKLNQMKNDAAITQDNTKFLSIIDDKNKELDSLKDKLTSMVDSELYQEKIEEIEKLEKEVEDLKSNFKKSLDEKTFPEETKNILDLLKIYFPEYIDSEVPEELFHAISSDLHKNKEQLDSLKDKLTSMVDSELYQEKIEEIEKLEKEVEDLKSKIEEMKEIPISGTTTDYDNEDNLEKVETISKDEAKPKNKAKLIVIIIGSIFLFILTFFIVGSYLLSEEEPTNMNTNYAVPVQKHTQVEPEIEPIKKVENEPKSIETTPQNLQNIEVYDFDKEISFDEFKIQKFDIYTDNYEKIRVNKKDFFRGDLINGYRLVRANSEGKILFVDKNSNPVWIEMK